MKRKAAIFASAFVIGLSGAMMPGPLLTASVGYTLERGFWAGGPLLVLGHALLEGTLVVMVLVGLGPVLSRRAVGAVIGVVGGAVLLWLGHGMLVGAASGAASLEASLAAGSGTTLLWASPVVAGVVISLANPYWLLWWATIGLKYLSVSRQAGRGGVVAFFCGHQLSDVAWYCSVAGALALWRRVIPDLAYRWIIGGCGVVLLGFGVFFVAAAVRVCIQAWRGTEPPSRLLSEGDGR